MKYTDFPSDTMDKLTLNAGIMLSEFDPETGEFDKANIIGATSGGLNVTATPSFTDFGEDIDNCPNNMMELKRLESWEIKASGTLLSVDTKTAKSLAGLADISGNTVQLRNDIELNDFSNIWIVADYSTKNGEKNGGFIAVKLSNALSTGGFQIQTGDNSKGQFSFEYTAHYSMDKPNEVPCTIYIKEGTAEA